MYLIKNKELMINIEILVKSRKQDCKKISFSKKKIL